MDRGSSYGATNKGTSLLPVPQKTLLQSVAPCAGIIQIKFSGRWRRTEPPSQPGFPKLPHYQCISMYYIFMYNIPYTTFLRQG